MAAERHAVVQLKLLLSKGADPRKVDGFGRSPYDDFEDRVQNFHGAADTEVLELFRQSPVGTSEHRSVNVAAEGDVASRLLQLSRLVDAGRLSVEEFAAAKALVLQGK